MAEASDGPDTLDVAHVPFELVERLHGRVVEAAFRGGLPDHRQHVNTDVEESRDFGHVPVVDGIRPQFRHTLMQVADPDVGSPVGPEHH